MSIKSSISEFNKTFSPYKRIRPSRKLSLSWPGFKGFRLLTGSSPGVIYFRPHKVFFLPENIISADLSDSHKYSGFVHWGHWESEFTAVVVILKTNRSITRSGLPVELDSAREMLRFAIKIDPGLTESCSSNRARGLCLLRKLKIMD